MHVWHNKYTHTNTWQRLITETMIRQLPVQIKWSIEGFLHVILLSCHKQRVYKYWENSLNFGGVVCYGCLYLPVAHCSILWPFRLEPLDSPDLVWLLHRQGCGSVDQYKRCCLALLNQQIKGMQLQWKKNLCDGIKYGDCQQNEQLPRSRVPIEWLQYGMGV